MKPRDLLIQAPEALRRHPLFAGVSKNDFSFVLSQTKTKRYAAHELLVREGDHAAYGWHAASRGVEDGGALVL